MRSAIEREAGEQAAEGKGSAKDQSLGSIELDESQALATHVA
jgi:hypothetical protein